MKLIKKKMKKMILVLYILVNKNNITLIKIKIYNKIKMKIKIMTLLMKLMNKNMKKQIKNPKPKNPKPIKPSE